MPGGLEGFITKQTNKQTKIQDDVHNCAQIRAWPLSPTVPGTSLHPSIHPSLHLYLPACAAGSQTRSVLAALSSHSAGFKGSQWLVWVGGRKPCTLATMCMFFCAAPGSAKGGGGGEREREGGKDGGRHNVTDQAAGHTSVCFSPLIGSLLPSSGQLDNYFVGLLSLELRLEILK